MNRVLNGSKQLKIRVGEQVPETERMLHRIDSGIRQSNVPTVLFDREMRPPMKMAGELVDAGCERFFRTGIAGDHKRYTCFIDEDRIGFVHECRYERPVNLVFGKKCQLIAQIIETHL